MRALMAGLILGAAVALPAQALTYRTTDGSEVKFMAYAPMRENGVHGVCRTVSGTVEVPGGDFEKAVAKVSLKVNDFEEKSGMDQHTFTAVEAPRYPSVAFVSKKFTITSRKQEADGTHLSGTVEGLLNFHGITQPVSAPFTAVAGPMRATLDTEFWISLEAHKIEPITVVIITIRDKVKIEAHLEAEAI